MPWVESLSDPQELRHCVRDLGALSTLPAIWTVRFTLPTTPVSGGSHD
jgi:hypothetical protein